jgi:hypothetical protein
LKINNIIENNPNSPDSWIRLLIQCFKQEKLIDTTKIVHMDILFRIFETKQDAVLRKALFPKLLDSTHPVVSSVAKDGRTLGEQFIMQLEAYLTDNQPCYKTYYGITDFPEFERQIAQENEQWLTIKGFKNSITQRLQKIPYPSILSRNMGLEVEPQFTTKPFIHLPVLTGFNVGMHTIEPLVRTPEQVAQIKSVLGIDLLRLPILKADRDIQQQEELHSKMRDVAIKDRLEQIIPTLNPEQLTFVPSEQVPIDKTLLPTLKQLFLQKNNTTA